MNALALASQTENKDIKLTGKKTLDSKSDGEENLFDNIIAGLVIGEEKEEDGSFLLSKLLSLSSDVEKTEEILSDFSKGNLSTLSQGEQVVISDLLKVAMMLKKGEDPATFPTQSKSLKIALSKPEVIEQFKGAKNIKQLLDIAKKNNIEVKNFQFFQEEAALDPKDKKIIQKLTSQDIFKLIEKRVDAKSIQNLSPLDITKDFIKPEKSDKNILQSILASKEVNRPITEQQIKTKNIIPITEQQIKTKNVIPITEQQIKTKNVIPITEQQIKTKNVIPITEQQNIKNNISIQDQIIIKKEKPTIDKKVILKNSSVVEQKIEIKESKTFKETISIKKAETVEQKIEINKSIITKGNFKNSIKNLNTIQQTNNEVKTDFTKLKPTLVAEVELNNNDKTTFLTETKTTTVDKVKSEPEVKKTFNTFAQEFKEKVENYKPPLMKIKMELKPAGMGEVDVTLLTRGNNLQVNINSNTNTIAMFMQNQAEFKNSLINMGFSDLQMNFGEQQKKEQEQKSSKNNFNQFEDEDQNEQQDGFEMTIPQYV